MRLIVDIAAAGIIILGVAIGIPFNIGEILLRLRCALRPGVRPAQVRLVLVGNRRRERRLMAFVRPAQRAFALRQPIVLEIVVRADARRQVAVRFVVSVDPEAMISASRTSALIGATR